ncbi:MAG: heat-inducible transcriptional repressor HrcA [Clostridia bacterium]|nr:heat-inducible transcriptional repressor HrcA [Clostridia bacterium]
MELSERRKKILQIVVDDYIQDIEPVSSKKVQQSYLQELSTATIRGELAALEDMGYLAHPHTSAGKIPLPKAYRYYVDKLMGRGALSEDEIDYIQSRFTSNINETEALIKNAAKVISDITNYAGLGIESDGKDERIDNIKLVLLSPSTALLIVVTQSKVLKDSILETGTIDEMYMETGGEILRKIFCGKKISEAVKIGSALIEKEFNRYRKLFENILHILKDYIKQDFENVFTEGAVNALSNPEFSDIERAKKFLSIVGSKEKIASMLRQDNANSVELTVKIGSDENEEYKDLSLVTANYSLKGKALGASGVIGPIRMDYRKVISVLECIRSTIDEMLKN